MPSYPDSMANRLSHGPRFFFPDEEPEHERITVGWKLTSEDNGFCKVCGWEGHDHYECPNRPANFIAEPATAATA
jgi:hypothetical protein